MGLMTIVPGTTGIAPTNAPKIIMTDWERQICNLPGLRHVIDPASSMHLLTAATGFRARGLLRRRRP